MRIRAALRPGASLGIVGLAVVSAVIIGIARSHEGLIARCGRGFQAHGSRCDPEAAAGECPEPLVATSAGCDAPDRRVAVPAMSFWLGPSDWEAEGRVLPRWIHVNAFRMDAFETTVGRWQAACEPNLDLEASRRKDGTRAASGMSRDEAAAFCGSRGGRLPTEDEWMAAAAFGSQSTRRYPWGDTGAVCRRAAWGLWRGPCGFGATGPDTVGAHADGDSTLGIHDLAGNVAEWVSTDAASAYSVGVAKGGSWQSALASDLRIWSRLEVPPNSRDPRIGVRCAYSP
jgi:formylglycine-generating enzyme required for sulfatase activity